MMERSATPVRRRGLWLAVLALLLLAAPLATHAATLTVIQTTDGVANPANCPGTLCRLRDAIAKASSGDTINFGFSGVTISLTQGELLVDKDLTITVAGTCDVSIDAHGASRVFDIAANKTLTLNGVCIQNGAAPVTGDGGGIRVQSGATLNLSNVTVQNNHATGAGPRGGAIYNGGTLNISGFAFFSGNSAGNNTSLNSGGAIYNDGSATLSGATDSAGLHSLSFTLNHASEDGGSIYNNGTMTVTQTTIGNGSANDGGGIKNAGTLTVARVLLTTNSSSTVGGGIDNLSGGTLTVADSTLALNSAKNNGGGIYNEGTLNVVRSTLSGNSTSAGTGGGLSNANGGGATLVNSTLSGNSATAGGGGLYEDNATSSASLNNVTISDNTADSNASGSGNGGGIRVVTGTLNIKNSIIAGNFDTPNNGGPGTIDPDCAGALNSQGYNLLRIDAGCSGLSDGVNGDQVGTLASPINAQLGPLASNGGPTQTHALLPGSPAIDRGNPAAPGSGGNACATHDQRGYPRGGGAGRCDIGAYERVFVGWLPVIAR